MYRLFGWCKNGNGDIWYLGKVDGIDKNKIKSMLGLSDDREIKFRKQFTDIMIDLVNGDETFTIGHLALMD